MKATNTARVRSAEIAAVEEELNVSISNVCVFHHENGLDYSCDARKHKAWFTYPVVKAKDETLHEAVARAIYGLDGIDDCKTSPDADEHAIYLD